MLLLCGKIEDQRLKCIKLIQSQNIENNFTRANFDESKVNETPFYRVVAGSFLAKFSKYSVSIHFGSVFCSDGRMIQLKYVFSPLDFWFFLFKIHSDYVSFIDRLYFELL